MAVCVGISARRAYNAAGIFYDPALSGLVYFGVFCAVPVRCLLRANSLNRACLTPVSKPASSDRHCKLDGTRALPRQAGRPPPDPQPRLARHSTRRRSIHYDGIRHKDRDESQSRTRQRLERSNFHEFDCSQMAWPGRILLVKNRNQQQLKQSQKACSLVSPCMVVFYRNTLWVTQPGTSWPNVQSTSALSHKQTRVAHERFEEIPSSGLNAYGYASEPRRFYQYQSPFLSGRY